MKFGKYLESQTVPEWSGKYVNYKGIRKSLKTFKSEIEALNIHIRQHGTHPTAAGPTSGGSVNEHFGGILKGGLFMLSASRGGGGVTPAAIELENVGGIQESMDQLKQIQDRLIQVFLDEVARINDFFMEREKEAQDKFEKLKIQVPLYLKAKHKKLLEERENEADDEINMGETFQNDHPNVDLYQPPKPTAEEEHKMIMDLLSLSSKKKEMKLKRQMKFHEDDDQDDDDDKRPLNLTLQLNGIGNGGSRAGSDNASPIDIQIEPKSDDDDEEIEMATVYTFDELMSQQAAAAAAASVDQAANDHSSLGKNQAILDQIKNTFKSSNPESSYIFIKNRLKQLRNQISETGNGLLEPIEKKAKQIMHKGKQKSDESLLKEAFREYYHFLVILKNYQVLNFTAFVKILKKAEKNTGLALNKYIMPVIETMQFKSSKKVEVLTGLIEKYHSELFNKGKVRDSRKQLRNSEKPVNPTTSTFFTGVCTGWSTAIVILIYYFIYTGEYDDFSRFNAVYNMYSALGLMLLWAFVFGIDVFIWTKFDVHYSFIFELGSKSKFTYHKIFQAVTLLWVLWITSIGIYMWVSVDTFPFPFVPAEWNPLLLLAVYMCILLYPKDAFQLSNRKWFLNTIFRVVTAPLKSVKFKDFFMGDQLSSLVLMMVQFSSIICFYSVDVWRDVEDSTCSAKARYINPFISGLPAWWRFIQCLRRYYDSKDFVHLRNALKYFLSIMTVFFSAMDSFYSEDGWESSWRIIWLLVAMSNSLYSYWWDIFMDWSILVRSKSNPYNPLKWTLRKKKMYSPQFVYYIAIISNLGFRLTWTLTKSLPQLTKILPSYKLIVIIGIVEIMRRGQWNLYRLENEHLNNCGKFRVTREIPLPYDVQEDE
ncbi:hypothetical protein CYY_005576 [Polysphondylium violaceum]|uniref:SPX domain-containing protein n=1 Tax=Polysphondylium violaceum TaxID=133409 RepID=A0A8J4PTD6_9MYCE|nr:hypothetical protein CYY_005576 [Polysphondylium violaceum]